MELTGFTFAKAAGMSSPVHHLIILETADLAIRFWGYQATSRTARSRATSDAQLGQGRLFANLGAHPNYMASSTTNIPA